MVKKLDKNSDWAGTYSGKLTKIYSDGTNINIGPLEGTVTIASSGNGGWQITNSFNAGTSIGLSFCEDKCNRSITAIGITGQSEMELETCGGGCKVCWFTITTKWFPDDDGNSFVYFGKFKK